MPLAGRGTSKKVFKVPAVKWNKLASLGKMFRLMMMEILCFGTFLCLSLSRSDVIIHIAFNDIIINFINLFRRLLLML